MPHAGADVGAERLFRNPRHGSGGIPAPPNNDNDAAGSDRVRSSRRPWPEGVTAEIRYGSYYESPGGSRVSWFVSPFLDNPFLQRSLLAGVLVAISCSIAGTFVVLRGLAFLGDALAHRGLPGVARAAPFGAPGILRAAVAARV